MASSGLGALADFASRVRSGMTSSLTGMISTPLHFIGPFWGALSCVWNRLPCEGTSAATAPVSSV